MTKTLEQSFTDLYNKLANHIKVHSPLLKAIHSSSGGVYISDYNGEAKMVGRYYKVEVDEKTNDAWLKFLEQTQGDFTLVNHHRGIGWQEMILWFPGWSNQMTYAEVVNYFTTVCPPSHSWHEAVHFLEIPQEAILFKKLGREFYDYDRDNATLYVDKDDILRHCSHDSRRVLIFCLENEILPEVVTRTGKFHRERGLDHPIYKVVCSESEFLVLVSRDYPLTVQLHGVTFMQSNNKHPTLSDIRDSRTLEQDR